MRVLKKILILLLSCGIGLAAGTTAAAPVIAVMNYRAVDGPIFPAPLVAFGFLALPIGLLLFLIQVLAVTIEAFTQKPLGKAWLLTGGIGGLAAGFLWYQVLASSQATSWMLLALCAMGVFQGLIVFGCHWVAARLKFINF